MACLSSHGVGLASVAAQHHPQRVAMWFTWGDLGYTGVKSTCGNKYCCNPFHLIPQNIGVFVDSESYLESFELACELHTLKQQVAEYVVEQALKEQEKLMEEARALMNVLILIFAPDSDFADRFEAVMEDMLAGNHISQFNDHKTRSKKIMTKTHRRLLINLSLYKVISICLDERSN